MRKTVSLVLALVLAAPVAGVARAAFADSVGEKLARARAQQQAARRDVAGAEAHLGQLLHAYRRLQDELNQAAKDVVAGYAAEEELSQQLAEARERLNERVTTAYELGPVLAVDVFLGAQSPADFASAQVFAATTFQVDDSSVAEVIGLNEALADSTARLEAKQQDLASSVGRVEAMAAAAGADVAQASRKARAVGLTVDHLEREQRELEAARAAAAAELGTYLGSGHVGAGCASGPVHDLIVKAFSPLGQAQVKTALVVATRESNCRPDAYNSTYVAPYGNASGVFQILTPGIWVPWSERCGYRGASPFDPKANVAVAACVVRDQGWWPWGF